MASAGGDRPPSSNVRRVIRIPLVRAVPGQHITITLRPTQGGPQPQIRVVPAQMPQQPGGDAPSEAVSRALQEQEEVARRVAEDNHRRAQLHAALSNTQPPQAEYSIEESVVRLSWQPVVVAGGDEVEYTVRGWKDGAGEPITLYRGQLTTCVVTTETLCRGHTHQVAVCASSAGESGDLSQRSEVEVPALPPDQPLPPKIASRTKSSLGLRWNPPPSNGSAISEYCLEWDQSRGEFVQLFSGKAKQFKFNHKFQPGSCSLFRVRARNAIGWSENSEETTFSVGQAPPAVPLPPSLSSCTPHSLTLHWAPPPGPAPVSSFCLEMDDPNSGYGFCPVYQGDGLSYTCRDLQRVTVYSFRLAATNEAGTSPTSPPISFTTLSEAPGHPGAICLHDRPHSTSLSLGWSPPSNDGGSPIVSYLLQVDDGVDGDLTDVYRGPEVTFRLDSLTPGRSYRCRVCAISSGGQGVWSKEALFQTPPSLPHPPSDLSVVGKVTQSSTALSWSRPASDGGSVIICYEVQSREKEEEWVVAGTVAEPFSSPPLTSYLTHTLTHLTPGTQYSARVSCRNTVGLSEWSDCVSFTTAPGPPSSPPVPSVAMVTAYSVQLQWTSSLEFGSALLGYEVEWGPVGGARHTMSLPQSPCTASLSHLTADTRHSARIKAMSEAGHSDWSPLVTFTTSPSTPSPPSHLALVSSSPNDLLVAWSVPPSPGSPLTHYHIQIVPPPSPDSTHIIVLPTETQACLEGLQPSTQYTVRVQAENSMGPGPLSSPLTASTLPPPPLPPSLSLVSCTPNTLRVSWSKKTNKSITYILQQATDSGRFHTVYTGSAVSHKVQKLMPATRYTLRIAASSLSGQGVWSDHLTCETLPPGPSVPLDLSMQQEGDVIVMSWGEASHPHPVTYELQLKSGSLDFTQVYRGPTTSHTHSITTYTRHQARVRACASCHANNRQEQLFSGFSLVASHDCDQPIDSASPDASNEAEETGPAVQDGAQLSQFWLLLLFIGMSVVVVVIAITLGQLLVVS